MNMRNGSRVKHSGLSKLTGVKRTGAFLQLSDGLRFVKIRTRLIIAFLLLSMVPLAIVGVIAYQKSSSAIESRIGSYSAALVSQVSRNIRTETLRTENVALDIAISEDVQKTMEYWSHLETADRLTASKQIKLSIGAKTVSNKTLLNTVIFLDEETTFGGNQTLFDKNVFGLRMKAAEERKGAAFWQIEPGKDGKQYLVLNKGINSQSSFRPLGVISIVVKQDAFGEILKSVDLGAGTEIFIMDEKNRLIANNDPDKEKSDVFGTAFRDISLSVAVKTAIEAKQDTIPYTLDKDRKLVAFSSIEGTDWTLYAAIPYSFLVAESNAIRNIILLIGFLCLLAALTLSFFITSSISGPLSRLVKGMQDARGGNLSLSFRDSSRDEISVVMTSFNEMLANINILVTQVGSASGAVLVNSGQIAAFSARSHETSEQVSRTVEEIAKGAAQQARDIAEGVGQLQTLAQNIGKAGEGIATMSGVVRDTQKLSEEALLSVQLLTDRALETNEASGRVLTDINSLSADMKEIEKITKVIVGISDQTNLLALNAAIEAARAGDAGRGFAVVSDEVRLLAEQSKQASVLINNILASIRRKTETTVHEAGRTGAIVQKQMEAVRETDNSFKTIHAAMERITRQITLVGESVDVVVVSKDRAIDTFGEVSAVSEETAATTEEVAASAQEQIAEAEGLSNTALQLQEMAQALNETVSRFQV